MVNSRVFEGPGWHLPQMSSQARVTSIESNLFQSVCKELLGPASRRRSWMTTAVPRSAAAQRRLMRGGGGGAKRILRDSSKRNCLFNPCEYTNKQILITDTPYWKSTYPKKKTSVFLFRKDLTFFLFLWLVVENVLMSNSSGFNFDQILPSNDKVLYLLLVGEGVLMSNPSGLQ